MSRILNPTASLALMQLAFQFYGQQQGLLAIDRGFLYDQEQLTTDVSVRVHFVGRNPTTVTKPAGGEALHLMFFRRTNARVRYKESLRSWLRWQKELRPGISIGHKEPGSFGLFGRDKKHNNKPALLTCRHLFSESRKQNPLLYQPAPRHERISRRTVIGKVDRYLKGLDVAVVHLNKWRKKSNQLFTIGREKHEITSLRPVQLGDILVKSGCKTGLTRAMVDGVGLLIGRRGRKPQEVFRLVPVPGAQGNELEISAGGDSGAIWMDPETGAGVGLHIAGDVGALEKNDYAFALHLEDVCREADFILA